MCASAERSCFTATAFELEELLRASAEMLGKGGCGTAYGSVVAVKRLRDAAPAAASTKKLRGRA